MIERTPHRERQAAEDIAQGLLHRETDHRREDRGGGQDRKRCTPKSVYSTTITTTNHNTSISRSLLMFEKWTLPRRVIAVDAFEHETDHAEEEKYQRRDRNLLADHLGWE